MRTMSFIVRVGALLAGLAAGALGLAQEGEVEATVEDDATAAALEGEELAQAGEAQAAEAQAAEAQAAEAQAAEAQAATGESKPLYDFVSDGSRIEIKDKEFSIQPPKGWEVFTNQPNLTLLMQAPHDKAFKYQRTIQIASFAGPKFIDELTAKAFEEEIVRKFSQTSASIENFRMRNHLPIEMADGRQGMLFYAEYKMYGVDLMQAHILVSTKDRHFLMTFSDLAEHFENEEKGQFLTEAWDAMTSVQLDGRPPARFEAMVRISVVAFVLAAFAFGFYFIRKWRSGREYSEFAAGKGLDDVDIRSEPERPFSGADQPLSNEDEPISRMDDEDEDAAFRKRSKKKTSAGKPKSVPTPRETSAAPVAAKPAKVPPPPQSVPTPSMKTAQMPSGELARTEQDEDVFGDDDDVAV